MADRTYTGEGIASSPFIVDNIYDLITCLGGKGVNSEGTTIDGFKTTGALYVKMADKDNDEDKIIDLNDYYPTNTSWETNSIISIGANNTTTVFDANNWIIRNMYHYQTSNPLIKLWYNSNYPSKITVNNLHLHNMYAYNNSTYAQCFNIANISSSMSNIIFNNCTFSGLFIGNNINGYSTYVFAGATFNYCAFNIKTCNNKITLCSGLFHMCTLNHCNINAILGINSNSIGSVNNPLLHYVVVHNTIINGTLYIGEKSFSSSSSTTDVPIPFLSSNGVNCTDLYCKLKIDTSKFRNINTSVPNINLNISCVMSNGGVCVWKKSLIEDDKVGVNSNSKSYLYLLTDDEIKDRNYLDDIGFPIGE